MGREGSATRWTGSGWSVVDAGTALDLNDVWVEREHEAYVVGNAGTLARIDESGWTAIDAGTTRNLRAVWGDGDGTQQSGRVQSAPRRRA